MKIKSVYNVEIVGNLKNYLFIKRIDSILKKIDKLKKDLKFIDLSNLVRVTIVYNDIIKESSEKYISEKYDIKFKFNNNVMGCYFEDINEIFLMIDDFRDMTMFNYEKEIIFLHELSHYIIHNHLNKNNINERLDIYKNCKDSLYECKNEIRTHNFSYYISKLIFKNSVKIGHVKKFIKSYIDSFNKKYKEIYRKLNYPTVTAYGFNYSLTYSTTNNYSYTGGTLYVTNTTINGTTTNATANVTFIV